MLSSGEHLGPYWDGMGVTMWVLLLRMGGPGHNVWVLSTWTGGSWP
jgi:hypothetical protein